MPTRYQCSLCKGTFDVAEQAPAPGCVGMGARRGGMSIVTGAYWGVFGDQPEGAPTNCKGAGAAGATRAQFMTRKFHIPHFVPYTHYGNFNCTYDPGRCTLEIELMVFIDYKLDSGKSGEVLPAWTEQEKAAFRSECEQSVATHWSGQYIFQCAKQDYTGLFATPVFKLNFVASRGKANYVIDVFKDRRPFQLDSQGQPQAFMPKCNGALIPSQLSTGNIDAVVGGSFQSFHARTLDIPFKATNVIETERTRLTTALTSTGAVRVSFGRGNNTLTDAAKLALNQFVAALRLRLPSTPAIPIQVKPITRPAHAPTLAAQRVDAVRQHLSNAGAAAHTVVGAGTSQDADVTTAEEAGVALSMDPDFGGIGSFVPSGPGQPAPAPAFNYDYNVFAHEFGHMLGLPDEYNNETGTGTKAQLQRNFQVLAHQVGVAPPTFGAKTSSLMSEGVDLLPHHFVTLWNALCALSRGFVDPGEWSIQRKP